MFNVEEPNLDGQQTPETPETQQTPEKEKAASPTSVINAELETSVPECPICVSWLCDPLTIGCGHTYCRHCLLKSTKLSPDGRSCPLCRALIGISNIVEAASDSSIEAAVITAVSPDRYAQQVHLP